MGVQPGDHIGLISKNSPTWILLDLAIQTHGAITVPLFPNIAEENFLFEKKDANINLLILESPNLLDPELQAHLPDFNKILLLNKEENVGKNYFFLDDLIEQ